MESLNLIKNDPWLAPYKEAIEGRYQYVVNKEKNLTGNGRQTLSEMASGYLYFGLHKTKSGGFFVSGHQCYCYIYDWDFQRMEEGRSV